MEVRQQTAVPSLEVAADDSVSDKTALPMNQHSLARGTDTPVPPLCYRILIATVFDIFPSTLSATLTSPFPAKVAGIKIFT